MGTTWRAIVTAAAIAATAACAFQHSETGVAPTSGTSGSSAPAISYLGLWSSLSDALPPPSSCSNFEWTISSQTSNSLSGTFAMDCPGISVTGTASGQLVSSTDIPITVTGTAVIHGVNCGFSLNGTGTVIDNGTALSVAYTGTTCLGPVHGTEVLRKKSSPPPEPPPEPPPAPAPPPPPPDPAPADPLFGCGGQTSNKLALVTCLHDAVNPAHTPEGAFEVTKRVAWALRGEGAGLLIKNGGENIVYWQGHWFAAARICYPDGHIYKVLTDVPTTNGPSWQDNGYVDPALYVPAIDPS